MSQHTARIVGIPPETKVPMHDGTVRVGDLHTCAVLRLTADDRVPQYARQFFGHRTISTFLRYAISLFEVAGKEMELVVFEINCFELGRGQFSPSGAVAGISWFRQDEPHVSSAIPGMR